MFFFQDTLPDEWFQKREERRKRLEEEARYEKAVSVIRSHCFKFLFFNPPYFIRKYEEEQERVRKAFLAKLHASKSSFYSISFSHFIRKISADRFRFLLALSSTRESSCSSSDRETVTRWRFLIESRRVPKAARSRQACPTRTRAEASRGTRGTSPAAV